MAYLKPAWFARTVFNPLAERFGIAQAEKLTVPGRTSGQPRSVPVVPVEVDGVCYVVSARGETDWVRNVRAAGRAELSRRGAARTVTMVEVPVAQSAPMILAYREKAGRPVMPLWEKLPSDADHPTFRAEPVG